MLRLFRPKTRHTVLSALFVTWVVSQIDRTAMSVALPYISADYRLNPVEAGVLMSTFFAGYAISHIPGGLLADMFGVRRVAALAMLWWSVFTAVTGAMANFTQMLAARFVFGLGEGVFPACAFKAVAIWFPKEERATASAIMIASNPLGMALGPLAVVAVMGAWGWRAAFYSLFLIGAANAILFWLFVPNDPSGGNNAPGPPKGRSERIALTKGALTDVLRQRHMIKYFAAYFFLCVGAWAFITWLPTYLVNARGLSMKQMGLFASLPFLAGAIGGVVNGWISDRLFKNNRRVPVIAVQLTASIFLYLMFSSKSVESLVLYQTLAGFFLMSISPCFWALPMSTIPESLMGVASGFINMAGQVAGIVAPMVLGYLVDVRGGNYDLAFVFIVGSLLVSAAVVCTIRGESPARDEAAALVG